MTLTELIKRAEQEGYSGPNARAKVCQDIILKVISESSFNIKQARNPPSSASGGMNCRKIQKKNKKNTCSRTKEVI